MRSLNALLPNDAYPLPCQDLINRLNDYYWILLWILNLHFISVWFTLMIIIEPVNLCMGSFTLHQWVQEISRAYAEIYG
jgi:hypothetical protein